MRKARIAESPGLAIVVFKFLTTPFSKRSQPIHFAEAGADAPTLWISLCATCLT